MTLFSSKRIAAKQQKEPKKSIIERELVEKLGSAMKDVTARDIAGQKDI